MKLLRFRNARSAERGAVILPLINDAERSTGRARAMSVGTRVDLMLLACWLVAAGLAAIVIVAFLLYSSLPAIARGG